MYDETDFDDINNDNTIDKMMLLMIMKSSVLINQELIIPLSHSNLLLLVSIVSMH